VLVLATGLVLIVLRFLYWRSCVSVMLPSGIRRMSPPLNLSGVLTVSCSCSLAINLALCSSFCSLLAKDSSARSSVLSVWRTTIPKGSLL
jgi:hypothetical protein